MKINDALLLGRTRLEAGSITAPRLTAEVLLCRVLGCERAFLYAHGADELTGDRDAGYEAFVRRRLAGEPTQYITGVQEFYGREFLVSPSVMIPRPETEHLIEAALGLASSPQRVVDVGTGSGAIAVTLQLEIRCQALATDVSRPALWAAAENCRRLGADVSFIAGDLLSPLAAESVDAVVSNPPYVPAGDRDGLQREVRDFEPHIALFGGPDGLDLYRRLVTESCRVLRPGGWLFVELGIRQLGAVRAMLGAEWRETKVLDDLAGLPRVLAARYRA